MSDDFLKYRIFLDEFRTDDETVPIKIGPYRLNDSEIIGEVINWSLQYLIGNQCPSKLKAPIVRNVVESLQSELKKDPSSFGFDENLNTYESSKLKNHVTISLNTFRERLLDNVELNKILPKNLTSIYQTPICETAAIKNTRRYMEDRHIWIDDFDEIYGVQNAQKTNFYAVFDGHNGNHAAYYTVSQLPYLLATNPLYPSNPTDAMREAFRETDNKFVKKTYEQSIKGGTTALCALHLPSESKLFIGWVGDSKALLVKQGKIMQIVHPHKPDDPKEKLRIINAGGTVFQTTGTWRVDGILNLSRAIGDSRCKPYVTGDPDIVGLELDNNEEFLVLACDGLWDYVDEESVAEIIYSLIEENCENLKIIPEKLVQEAKKEGSTDNITVLVVFLKNPKEIIKLNCPIEVMEPAFDNCNIGEFTNNASELLAATNTQQIDFKTNDQSNNEYFDENYVDEQKKGHQLMQQFNDGLNNFLQDPVNMMTAITTGDLNNHHFEMQQHQLTENNDNNFIDVVDNDEIQRQTDKFMDNMTTKMNQMIDEQSDFGAVDVTDDNAMITITENSEYSTLSHSKQDETLPLSDHFNPFDDNKEFEMNVNDGAVHMINDNNNDEHDDDDGKSTPMISPDTEEIMQHESDDVISPIECNDRIEEIILKGEQNLDFEIEQEQQQQQQQHNDEPEKQDFIQTNGHISPLVEHEQEAFQKFDHEIGQHQEFVQHHDNEMLELQNEMIDHHQQQQQHHEDFIAEQHQHEQQHEDDYDINIIPDELSNEPITEPISELDDQQHQLHHDDLIMDDSNEQQQRQFEEEPIVEKIHDFMTETIEHNHSTVDHHFDNDNNNVVEPAIEEIQHNNTSSDMILEEKFNEHFTSEKAFDADFSSIEGKKSDHAENYHLDNVHDDGFTQMHDEIVQETKLDMMMEDKIPEYEKYENENLNEPNEIIEMVEEERYNDNQQQIVNEFVHHDDNNVEAKFDQTDLTGTASTLPTAPELLELLPEKDQTAFDKSDDEFNYMRLKEGDGEKEKTLNTIISSSGDTLMPEELSNPFDNNSNNDGTELNQTTELIEEKIVTTSEFAITKEANIDFVKEEEKVNNKPSLNLNTDLNDDDDNNKNNIINDDEMNYQLNPEAKEFVPLSPTLTVGGDCGNIYDKITLNNCGGAGNGIGNVEKNESVIITKFTQQQRITNDDVVAQSPRKGNDINMDEIQIPDETEFDWGANKRPHDIIDDDDDTTKIQQPQQQPINYNPVAEFENCDMKESIYIENSNSNLDDDNQEYGNDNDILNRIQMLPDYIDNTTKDNSFEFISNKETIISGENEKDIASPTKDMINGNTIDISKNYEDINNEINALNLSDNKNHTDLDVTATKVAAAVGAAAALIGVGTSVIHGKTSTTTAAATSPSNRITDKTLKTKESEKNIKNKLNSVKAPPAKVPEKKTTTTTSSSITKITSSTSVPPKKSVTSSTTTLTKTNSKPKTLLVAAAPQTTAPKTLTFPRPRTAPSTTITTNTSGGGNGLQTKSSTSADKKTSTTTMKSTTKPATLTVKKSSNTANDITKTSTAATTKMTVSKTGNAITSSVSQKTSTTNMHNKARPTSATSVTNGTATTMKSLNQRPNVLSTVTSTKSVSTSTKTPSLSSPRGTHTSQLRKTEAIKNPSTKPNTTTNTNTTTVAGNRASGVGPKSSATSRTTTTTTAARTSAGTVRKTTTTTTTSSSSGGGATKTTTNKTTNVITDKRTTPIKRPTTTSSAPSSATKKSPNGGAAVGSIKNAINGNHHHQGKLNGVSNAADI